MKISKPATSWSKGKLRISYNQGEHSKALDLGEACMTTVGYSCIKSFLKYHDVIITNHDIIGDDEIINSLSHRRIEVVLYMDKKLHKMQPNKQRLMYAKEKLENAGIRVKYFASRSTAEKYINKLK